MKSLLATLLLSAGSALLLSSCNKISFWLDHRNPKGDLDLFQSAAIDVGNGKARSWITVSHLGAPVELGLELTRESLYNLADTDFHVAVPLPVRAKELTPFDHVYITWSSHGHRGPNDTSFIGPHYDVRFFLTTLEEHLAIPAPADSSAKYDVLPPAGYMPDSFTPFGNLIGVGKTWTDQVGFPGIRKAMVLGSYNAKFTFVSPIVIIEELRSGNSSSTSYEQPRLVQEHQTYYPTKYNIYADVSKQKHQVTLSNFVLR